MVLVIDLFEKEPIQMGEGKDSLFPPNTKIKKKREKKKRLVKEAC